MDYCITWSWSLKVTGKLAAWTKPAQVLTQSRSTAAKSATQEVKKNICSNLQTQASIFMSGCKYRFVLAMCEFHFLESRANTDETYQLFIRLILCFFFFLPFLGQGTLFLLKKEKQNPDSNQHQKCKNKETLYGLYWCIFLEFLWQ